MICKECCIAEINKERKQGVLVFKWIIPFAIIGIVVAHYMLIYLKELDAERYKLSLDNPIAVGLIYIYLFISLPLGWHLLSKIKFEFILLMPIIGWLIYFGIKITLAWALGIYLAPIIAIFIIRKILICNKKIKVISDKY
ncbi:MAG: hypothetical protein N4A47_00830 [Clostridia bacterium]|nr:hypothetical protein [Clostridia bacterium]